MSASALEENSYTDTGVCGASANWYFYENTGTLSISGSGAVTDSNWAIYNDLITKIIVSEGIESLSKDAFYGCTNLQEISLPFVGESRSAVGPNATFGYIFDYTTMNCKKGSYSYI